MRGGAAGQAVRNRAIKFFNNIVVIATCAFTGFLFLSYSQLHHGISEPLRYGLVAVVVLCAVLSSTDIGFVKVLSIASTWLFFLLIAVMWLHSGMSLGGFFSIFSEIGGYFENIRQFVMPLTDYHAFYLFWWFSWSIMIGQFVSRFVGGLKTWQLLLALLIIPSIPISIWFSVLYYYYVNHINISFLFNMAMVLVGVVFVINSLDSLIRLYTDNLNMTVRAPWPAQLHHRQLAVDVRTDSAVPVHAAENRVDRADRHCDLCRHLPAALSQTPPGRLGGRSHHGVNRRLTHPPGSGSGRTLHRPRRAQPQAWATVRPWSAAASMAD